MKKSRTWQVERAAAVRWIRWMAEKDDQSGCNHEAQIMRSLARRIEQGRHCMEGPPAIAKAEGA